MAIDENDDLFNFEDDLDYETTLVPTEDGGMEITYEEIDDEVETPDEFKDHNANIALFLPDEKLMEIASFCDARYQDDLESNQDNFDIIEKGLRKLGVKIEELTEPFPGASPITHPIILEAALKTQAKLMGEVFCGKGIVDTYLAEQENPETVEKSNRVKNYMDYQYLYLMDEFEAETEKLTYRYALTGNAYRKYYFDPIYQRQRTRFITEDKFIINTNATTIKDADFHTELYAMDQHDLEHLIELGEFREIGDILTPNTSVDGDAKLTTIDETIQLETGETFGIGTSGAANKYQMREQHCFLKLGEGFNDGETRALPYIVTIEESTNSILAIRRNWKEADALRLKRVWYSHYKLIPGLGFHGMGYIHILGNFQFAMTQIMRSLIDSGQFANLQAGFRAKGVRFTKDSNMPLRLGEFREIDTGSKAIGEVLYPLTFKEPSQVLERMVQWLDGRGGQFADSTEQVIADSTNYGPVGTTVALLEASTKFISGILKRFYKSLKEEYKILYDLNYDVLDDETSFYIKGKEFSVRREDFDGKVDVLPSADPNMSSSAHRLSIANTKLQAALQSPEIHNLKEAYKEFYLSLGLEPEEIERLIPEPEEAQPLGPLEDIIAAGNGKPIKAFPGQDHDAHIAFKTAFLSDPYGGGQELAQSIIPLIQANMKEHALLRYVESVQGTMDQMQAATEQAQAEAAELVMQYHQDRQFQEAVQAKDPATMLAIAEQQNADTRLKEVEHKIENDRAKQMDAARNTDLKLIDTQAKYQDAALERAAQDSRTRLIEGSKMVTQALGDLNKPNPKAGKDQ